MSAGAIGGVAAGLTPESGASDAYANLSSDEFIKIMLTELTNQDPLQPNDSQAILEQLSSLRNIESQLSLQEQLESLVLQSGVTQAGGLIGKLVEGLDADDNTVSGVVTSVRVEGGNVRLELDSGRLLPLDRVTAVTGNNG